MSTENLSSFTNETAEQIADVLVAKGFIIPGTVNEPHFLTTGLNAIGYTHDNMSEEQFNMVFKVLDNKYRFRGQFSGIPDDQFPTELPMGTFAPSVGLITRILDGLYHVEKEDPELEYFPDFNPVSNTSVGYIVPSKFLSIAEQLATRKLKANGVDVKITSGHSTVDPNLSLMLISWEA